MAGNSSDVATMKLVQGQPASGCLQQGYLQAAEQRGIAHQCAASGVSSRVPVQEELETRGIACYTQTLIPQLGDVVR